MLGPGLTRFWLLPSLLWLDASDRMLHLLCWGGRGPGVRPDRRTPARASWLGLLWLFYLSLAVGRAGLPRIPVGFAAARGRVPGDPAGPLGTSGWAAARDEPWPLVVWLVPLAGLPADVPLGRGQAGQRRPDLVGLAGPRAPLPDAAAAHLDELVCPPAPAGFHWLSVGFMFYAELIAPFFIFGPRPFRLAGFVEPGAAPGPDRGDGQLRVLQPPVDRPLPVAGSTIATGAG